MLWCLKLNHPCCSNLCELYYNKTKGLRLKRPTSWKCSKGAYRAKPVAGKINGPEHWILHHHLRQNGCCRFHKVIGSQIDLNQSSVLEKSSTNSLPTFITKSVEPQIKILKEEKHTIHENYLWLFFHANTPFTGPKFNITCRIKTSYLQITIQFFRESVLTCSRLFFVSACAIAWAPATRIWLSQRLRRTSWLWLFRNLPTARAPRSLMMLCERSSSTKPGWSRIWLMRTRTYKTRKCSTLISTNLTIKKKMFTYSTDTLVQYLCQ